MNRIGQMRVASMAVAAVVVFVSIATGMAIISNVTNGAFNPTNTNPGMAMVMPFIDSLPIMIAAIAIGVVVLSVLGLVPSIGRLPEMGYENDEEEEDEEEERKYLIHTIQNKHEEPLTEAERKIDQKKKMERLEKAKKLVEETASEEDDEWKM